MYQEITMELLRQKELNRSLVRGLQESGLSLRRRLEFYQGDEDQAEARELGIKINNDLIKLDKWNLKGEAPSEVNKLKELFTEAKLFLGDISADDKAEGAKAA